MFQRFPAQIKCIKTALEFSLIKGRLKQIYWYLNTRFLAFMSCSNSEALIQSFTEFTKWFTACAMTFLAVSTGTRRAASSHRSSELGQVSQPRRIKLRAACNFPEWNNLLSTLDLLQKHIYKILPVTSSRRAEAIHAGGWLGFVSLTDFSSSLAFLMSLISPP